jgi:hypothetical protein
VTASGGRDGATGAAALGVTLEVEEVAEVVVVEGDVPLRMSTTDALTRRYLRRGSEVEVVEEVVDVVEEVEA